MDKVRLQAIALLLLRTGTGLLLMLWGGLRLISPQVGPGLAEKYYAGFMAAGGVQIAFGAAQLLLGLLVLLGLFRRVVYPLQALILVLGAAVLWRYLLDPMGVYLLSREDSQILFFPSITVAAATLVMIAFRDEDRLALDRLVFRTRAKP